MSDALRAACTAIKLSRIDPYVIVSVILDDGTEVEVIRELADGAFSHIVETSGIAKAIDRERGFQQLMGDRTP